VVPIIPLRKNSGHRESSVPRKTEVWRTLYRRRSAVEREFGRFTSNYGLAMLRVRAHRTGPTTRGPYELGRLSRPLSTAQATLRTA
jgi:hypothetical protein